MCHPHNITGVLEFAQTEVTFTGMYHLPIIGALTGREPGMAGE